jgi:hypothetical protein
LGWVQDDHYFSPELKYPGCRNSAESNMIRTDIRQHRIRAVQCVIVS